MIENTRYTWIDYAKFFSIALVVSYHTPPEPSDYWADMIRLIRMPAFFLISGFLFNSDKFPTYLSFFKHRSKQLLIPYLSFTVIFYVLWLLMGSKLGNAADATAAWYEPLVEFVLGRPELVVHPFWFICCLFCIQTIYYFLSKCLNRSIVLVICLLLPFVNCLTNEYPLPWELDKAFKYIPFYVIPNYLKNWVVKIPTLKLRYLWAIVSVVLFIGVYQLKIETTNAYLFTLTGTIAGLLILPVYILFCFNLARLGGCNVFIEYIGKNSIIILGIQIYIIKIIEIVTYRLIYPDFFVGKYYYNILITLFVIAISYIPIVFINKYIPFMIGRKANVIK